VYVDRVILAHLLRVCKSRSDATVLQCSSFKLLRASSFINEAIAIKTHASPKSRE
jgi:hypothetical protein